MFYMHLYAILYVLSILESSASFCFYPILGFQRKGKSNGFQLTWNFTELIFGPEEAHGASEMDQKSPEGTTRVEGTPYPLGAPPTS